MQKTVFGRVVGKFTSIFEIKQILAQYFFEKMRHKSCIIKECKETIGKHQKSENGFSCFEEITKAMYRETMILFKETLMCPVMIMDW